jgi:hypothetical protein
MYMTGIYITDMQLTQVLTRKKDGALHAEDSEVTGFADREVRNL